MSMNNSQDEEGIGSGMGIVSNNRDTLLTLDNLALNVDKNPSAEKAPQNFTSSAQHTTESQPKETELTPT